MRTFRLEPSANAHLDDIFNFSAARWGQVQAERYINALFDEFAAVATRRVPWRRIAPELGMVGYLRRCKSHVIYWREDDGEVAIVAILHERMHQSLRLREALDAPP